MTARELIRHFSNQSFYILKVYVADLSEDELLLSPAAGANHGKWQLGHLVMEAHRYLSWAGVPTPELPEGFAAVHAKGAAEVADPARFWPKQTYLDLLKAIHLAGLQHLESEPDGRLDEPGPVEARAYMPTVGTLYFSNLGGHIMMHVGQFASLRRALGKPVVI